MRKRMKSPRVLAAILAAPLLVAGAVAQEASFGLGATTPQVTAGSLARLPAGPEDLKFDGETQTRTMTFVAEPAQLAGSASLFLTMQSAVSVAPEWSKLTVAVNGSTVGTVPLRSGDPYSNRWDIPGELLAPGYNAVTFTVDQAHRVDCSIDATYELWTRIDPALSGFAFDSTVPPAADYLSLRTAVRAADGTTPLRGIVSSVMDEENGWILSVFQALAIGAAIDRPLTDFAPTPGAGPGIDVIVGPMADVLGRLGPTSLGGDLAPGVNLGRRADGRIVVAIVAVTAEDFATALATLSEGLRETRVGSPEGLAALDQLRGPMVEAHGRLSFTDLGIDGRSFGGRLFAQKVHFRLPADFYPADYAQAEIDLDALYASGLAPGAALQFKINDTIVSTTNLAGSRSRPEEGRRLPIALAAFRPGDNALEVEARLPSAIDSVCAPGATADNGRRLQLLGTSSLVLPRLARIGRFPDLGSLEHSIVGRHPDNELTVVAPRGNLAELGAAATLLTRLAYASGRILDTEVSGALLGEDDKAALIAGTLRDLPADISRRLTIDLAAAPRDVAGIQLAPPAGDAPGFTVPALPTVEDLTAGAGRMVDDVRASLYGLGLTVGMRLDALRTDDTALRPMAGADMVVGQVLNASGAAPVTVITAPTHEALVAGMATLSEDKTWLRLAGSAVAISTDVGVVESARIRAAQYYPTTDGSFGNIRLAIAGWMSNTPSIFALLALVSAIFLGLSTSWLLRRTRRSK